MLHVGDWFSFVSIKGFSIPEDVFQQAEALSACKRRVDDQHISLSRMFSLREIEIEGFVDDVRAAVEGIESFELTCNGFRCFQDRFSALMVRRGKKQLDNLVDCIDQVLLQYSKPLYYEDRQHHISLYEHESDFEESESCKTVKIRVTKLTINCGNREFLVELA